MFETPADAKSVRREDLYGSNSASESESEGPSHDGDDVKADLRAAYHARLSGMFNFDLPPLDAVQPPEAPAAPAQAEDAVVEEGPEEEAFEFRLFGGDGHKSAHTVVLTNDQVRGDGSFVVPRRPMSCYVAEEPSADAQESFRRAAVSANYILEGAKRRRWGLEKPWRVTTIAVTTKQQQKPSAGGTGQGGAKAGTERTRPGKKRRVILRTREKARRDKAEEAKKREAEKEEHVAEKKKRLNRLKKLRRRAKERGKKGVSGDEAGSEADSRGSSPE